ncbi:MAG: STAS domain-containing protein [Lachnospiraceae bacterium]|nr:STAS domain-containing protein [Lachnospiraceae bacterium]
MTIEEIKSENSLQINVEGKIDTLTSPEFQDVVLKSFQKSNNIIINFDKVPYISSAGLRALILGQKTASSKGGNLTLINVQTGVYSVFKETGFDKILNIK